MIMAGDLSIDPIFQQVSGAGVSALTGAATTLLDTGSSEVAASAGGSTMAWLHAISLGASVFQSLFQVIGNQNRSQEEAARESRTEKLLEQHARRNESNLMALAQGARLLLADQTKQHQLALVQSEERQAQARAWEPINAVMNDLDDRVTLYRDYQRQYVNDPSRLVKETKIFQREFGAFLKKLSNAMLRGLITRDALRVWINAAAFHIQMISHLINAGKESTESRSIAIEIHRETARNLFSAYRIHNQHASALGEIMEAEMSFHNTFNNIEHSISQSVNGSTSQIAGSSNQTWEFCEQREPSRHSSRSPGVVPPVRRSTHHLGRTVESDHRGKRRNSQSRQNNREPLNQQQHYEEQYISCGKQGHRGMHDHDGRYQGRQETSGKQNTRTRQQPRSQKNQDRRHSPHNRPESSEEISSPSDEQSSDLSEQGKPSRSSSRSPGDVPSSSESVHHLGRTCKADHRGKHRYSQDPQECTASCKQSRNIRESQKNHRKPLGFDYPQQLQGSRHPSWDQQQPHAGQDIFCGKQGHRGMHDHDGRELEKQKTCGRRNARAGQQSGRLKYQGRRHSPDNRPESSEASSSSNDEQTGDWSGQGKPSRSSSSSSGVVPSVSESAHHQKNHRKPLGFDYPQQLQVSRHPSWDQQQPHGGQNISCGKQGHQGTDDHDGSELQRQKTGGRRNSRAGPQPSRPKYQERRHSLDNRPESSEASCSSSDEQTKDWSGHGKPSRASSRSSGAVPLTSKSAHHQGSTFNSAPRGKQRYSQDPQEYAARRKQSNNKRESQKTRQEPLDVEHRQKLQGSRNSSRDQQQHHERQHISCGQHGHRRMLDHDGEVLERQKTGGSRNARSATQSVRPKYEERHHSPDDHPENSEESSSFSD